MKQVILYTVCPACRGCGRETGRHTWGSHDEEEWERVCIKCKGTGKVSQKAWIEEVEE